MQFYYRQRKIKPLYYHIGLTEYGNLTLLNFYRDVATLSDEELDLFINVLNQNCSTLLPADERITPFEADYQPGNTYKNLNINTYNNILAYREQGKVFVFNR